MRCVFVKLPSYSAIWVEGKKKISVLLSAIFTSPFFTSGPRYQWVAVSVSQLSFTTSQSSWRSACRGAPHRLQIRHQELRRVAVITGGAGLGRHVIAQRLVRPERRRRVHVPVDAVV